MMGAKKIPMITINASPLKSAYADAKTLALVLVSALTGPIPPKIIDAFRSESSQLRCAKKWYPVIPMNKTPNINKMTIPKYITIPLIKVVTGTIF